MRRPGVTRLDSAEGAASVSTPSPSARFDVKDMQATKATLQQRPDATAIDWRTAIPEQHRRSLRTWPWSIAAMSFGIIVIGGITRLTLSGLSIGEWRPFTGVNHPLREEEWLEVFEPS